MNNKLNRVNKNCSKNGLNKINNKGLNKISNKGINKINKKGIEMAWQYIVGFIILFLLLIWFIFYSSGIRESILETIKNVLGFI